MPSLIGGSVDVLAESMRFRMARQGALASNVVNADTPGYRRVDLAFDARLANASLALRRTDARHLGAGGAGAGGGGPYRTEQGPRGTRPDGNGVDLQHELVQLSRNAGAFSRQATVVSRLLALRRIPITGESR